MTRPTVLGGGAQTKHNCHCPWCEDGAYALGLGVLMPHTMVGVKTKGECQQRSLSDHQGHGQTSPP